MTNASAIARYRFIGHALRGDGPFRPVVTTNFDGTATLCSESYLTRYPRESDSKYARRNEVAFYDSPLAQACARFLGYMATKPPTRELPHELYQVMSEDIDGKGNAINVFFDQFLTDAKARGAGLLLVDMPADLAPSLAAQIAGRKAPIWTAIAPEDVTDYQLGDDGKFSFVEFAGVFTDESGKQQDCVWRFDSETWEARKNAQSGSTVIASGDHPCGECPVLIWTEMGDFPSFGTFASIADLSKRLFNLESELDEILRSQTFSLLTMQVEDGTTAEQKLAAAQAAGQTIGTQNLIVHSGSTPAFIAPPDGPATIYQTRIDKMRARIDEIGLKIASIDQQESGIAMTMRFQAINAELVRCSVRTEDLERRAWDLSAKWLGMQAVPSVEWPRDFNIADVSVELQILADMQAAAMPQEVIVQQQKRIVEVQFSGVEDDDMEEMKASIEERERGIDTEDDGGNVVPIDRNAPAREALMRLANGD